MTERISPTQKGAVVFGTVPEGFSEEQGLHVQEEMQLCN